ncbi:DUF1570 domain-containing protein [Thermogutta sp.]|uniref:DUF1570 domain-containing protein n=1 Tax=Thermogutta sp. TaxID=1962930 RepID=UPI00321F8C07
MSVATRIFQQTTFSKVAPWWLVVIFLLALGSFSTIGYSLDIVQIKEGENVLTHRGRILVQAVDGGVLLLTPEGRLLPLAPAEIVSVSRDSVEFKAAPSEDVARWWLTQLPAGFEVYQTAHYVVLHNTSRDYARWCASLLERLYAGFTAYFTNKGVTIEKPEFPLVVIIFSSRDQYVTHCRAEVGDGIEKIQGHYNLVTNVVTMYDLTGSGGTATAAQISRFVQNPNVQQSIATVVHEATHQLANNCGITCRWTDTPQWVAEGLAMFFETPDLRSARGWATVGAVNQSRLDRFRSYLSRRPDDSLVTLIRDNARFQNTETALDAYAEAWALTYFLLQQKRSAFLEYLKRLREKPPLVYHSPEERIREFTEIFGDVDDLNAQLLRFVSRLR